MPRLALLAAGAGAGAGGAGAGLGEGEGEGVGAGVAVGDGAAAVAVASLPPPPPPQAARPSMPTDEKVAPSSNRRRARSSSEWGSDGVITAISGSRATAADRLQPWP